MSIIISGLNRIVELVDNNFDIGVLGIGTAIETRDDTGAISGITASQFTMSTNTADKFVEKVYTLQAVTASIGSSIAEFAVVSSTASSGTAWGRHVFTATAHSTAFQWTVRTRYMIREKR